MSGRVKWVRGQWLVRLTLLYIDGRRVGDIYRGDHGSRAHFYEVERPRRTLTRRSDAKRWLLARAAGLAEVPRRVHVGPRGGSWSYVRRDAHTVWPPPGWHEVEEYIGDDGEVGVVLCERNRRRR